MFRQRRANDTEKLFAYPPGFRMLAGNPMLRNYTDVPEQQAISYSCLDYSGNGGPETKGFPQRNCAKYVVSFFSSLSLAFFILI
jgi:hypothetical protein